MIIIIIKDGLSASVRAEIDNHQAELAHKIGLLTLHEIVARLEKLAEHIRVSLYCLYCRYSYITEYID